MDLHDLLATIGFPSLGATVIAPVVIEIGRGVVQMLRNARDEPVRLRRLNQEASKLGDHDPVDEVLSAAMRRQVTTRLVSRLTPDGGSLWKYC